MKNLFTLLMGALFLCALSFSSLAANNFQQDLSAQVISVGIVLNWTARVQTDVMMYIIERSVDGRHYSNLGAVQATEDLNGNKAYSFLDMNATKEKAFYRLKQLNENGTYRYSKTIPVGLTKRGKVNLENFMSISTTGLFSFNIQSTARQAAGYQIKNKKGEIVTTSSINSKKGSTEIVVDLSNQPNGIYTFLLEDGFKVLLQLKSGSEGIQED